MANLIQSWINDEIKLSKIITNIEEDFSNGYLYGELFNKYNQISNFSEYKNKDDSESKISNFKRIEKAFRDIDIKIEKGRIFDIINKKRGVATRFLYMIKMTLAKKNINQENLLLKKSASIHDTYNNALYYSTRGKHVIDANKNNSNITLKEIDHPIKTNLKTFELNNPIYKFEKFKKLQELKIENEEKNQNEILQSEQDRNTINIKSLENDFHTRKTEMDHEQLIQWHKNMDIKKKFENNLFDDLNKQANFFKNLVFENMKNSENENKFQIENFEKNLSRLGLDMTNLDSKLKKSANNQVSGEIILQKIREKIQANVTAKKERDRRKRKIQIEHKKAQEEIQKNEKKNNLEDFENSKNISSEKDLKDLIYKEYNNWKDLHNINFINEKKLKELKEKEVRELNKDYDKIFQELFEQREKEKIFDREKFISELYSQDLNSMKKNFNKKISKREKNSLLIKKIFENIIDFTEEIYQYQINNNVNQIDQLNWGEWCKLFINNQTFSGFINKSEQNITETDRIGEIISISENEKKKKIKENLESEKYNNTNIIDVIYEECELFDYLNFLSQYNTEIIPSEMLNKMLDIFEVMGKDLQLQYNNSSKYGKSQYNAYKEYEPKDEDIENLTIPLKYEKNYNLGDIINILLDIKYNNENMNNLAKYQKTISSNLSENINNSQFSQINKNIFGHIPLKILFLGKKFSGRKTQIKILSETFPLKIYNIEDLIEKNLEILERLEIPIDQNPKYKSLKKNELEKLIIDRAVEEQKFEPLKSFILPIKEHKDKNEKIPEFIIFDFISEIIKQDFPDKTQKEILEEINIKSKKKKELLEEISKAKEEKTSKGKNVGKTETQYNQEIQKLSIESNKGFIIYDFPCDYIQAKNFENKICGYISEIEKPKNYLNQLRDNYFLILDKIFKPNNQINLTQGAFDLIFYLDISNEESLRRAKGRKIDPNSGIIYHIEDNPPPVEDKKLNERLHNLDEKINFEEFNDENIFYEQEIKKLFDMYNNFGFKKNNFKSLNKVLSMQNAENLKTPTKKEHKDIKDHVLSINSELSQFVFHIIKINEEKENEILMSQSYQTKELKDLKDPYNNTSESNFNINTNTLTNHINKNTESRRNSNSFLGNAKDLKKSNKEIINLMSHNYENNKPKNDINIQLINLNHNIQNPDEEDFDKYSKKLEEAKRKIPLSSIENIFINFSKMHENYISSTKIFFKNLRKQKENIIFYFNKSQDKFVEYLRRPSSKISEINKFQQKYNKFFDEYPQLRGDQQVREEFHQDISDLGDRIWEVIEERKLEAIEERKKIMTSGWVEKEMEKFYVNLEKLFVSEVEKFYTNINIIRDFYYYLDYKNAQDITNFNPYEILKDQELGNLPIFKEEVLTQDKINTYPKLEKLYKNSIKIILKYDEASKNIDRLIKSHVSNNISHDTSIRKLPRSYVKRAPIHDATFVIDDKREIFIYDEELRTTIKSEKNRYKFRVTFIKYWAIQYLENLKKISKLVIDKLDDWIISTIKAENDAMNNLINVFDACIEKEMRVRVDFEMDSFEIYKFIEVSDHIEILTTELPFRELSEKTCIDYSIFLKIFEEIKNYQISLNYITTQSFVDIAIKKYLIDSNGLGLPNIFKHLSFYNIKRFLTSLENVKLYNNSNIIQETNEKISFNFNEYF